MFRSVVVAIVVLTLFHSAPAVAGPALTVCGTGDSQELLLSLAAAYRAAHPDSLIDVPDSIGSSGGIRAVAEGKCDLGRVARPLKEKEQQYGLSYRLFAYTPVVFVTNSSVKLDNITTEQIISLFKGEITNWRQLGADDAKLYIAVRYQGDSSRTIIEKNIPALRQFIDWAGTVTYSTPETVEAVVKNDYTITFLPKAMAVQYRLNMLKFDGIAPSTENIDNGTYPLLIPLGLVWKGKLRGLAEDFVAFIYSDRGRQIIAENGAIASR